MAYLNEDGLETLVGKIKGQVIELTSAEYRQLPATKNTDNKLYFVNDEAYAYQIDDEPTSGSSGLVKSGGVYNWTSKIGSGTLTTTAQTIIPAVNELNAKIGSTDISTIGDGTVTGAVSELNNGLMKKTTFTGTTDEYGRLDLTFDTLTNVVIGALAQMNGVIVEQYYRRNNQLGLRCSQSSSLAAVTNTSVTIDVYYITFN